MQRDGEGRGLSMSPGAAGKRGNAREHELRGADTSVATLTWFSRMTEIWWTRNAGRSAIDAARASRASSLIAFARKHSPWYRRAWDGLPQRALTLAELPVATKRELMAHFDKWVTDRRVDREGIEAFLADRTHIGERYLDEYVVWKSSGSNGEPGIFVQNESALATYDALIAVQLSGTRLA